MSLDLLTVDAEELYNNLIQSVEIACGEPLYPGDERRIFAEAMVQVIVSIANLCNTACKAKFLQFAEGDALDALGARTNTTRLPATAASAKFQFILAEESLSDTVIPAGTLITTDGDIDFATDEDLTIKAGDTSGIITATCTTKGEEGNGYIAGSVGQLVEMISNIASAQNITTSTGGSDEEDDDEYRKRIKLANASFTVAGPAKAYKYWAKTADASIVDVGIEVTSACCINIYPLCKNGTLPTQTILDKVEAICSADNIRPLTDHVQALAPKAVIYDINIKYYVSEKDEAAVTEVIEGEDGVIARFVEWQGSALGKDINPDELIAMCVKPTDDDGNALTGCIRLDVTAPIKASVGEFEAAQVGTIVVTHEVVNE